MGSNDNNGGGFQNIAGSPMVVWGGIAMTTLFSFLGIENRTQDRFTGDDGKAMQHEIDSLEKSLSTFLVQEAAVRKQHDTLERLTRTLVSNQSRHIDDCRRRWESQGHNGHGDYNDYGFDKFNQEGKYDIGNDSK